MRGLIAVEPTKVTTKAGVTYKNGTLSGFNCRHYTIPYHEDGVRPVKLTDERVEKARAIEQEQRRLERRVYHLREKYYAFKDQNEKRALNYYRQAAQAKRDAEKMKAEAKNKLNAALDKVEKLAD